MFKIRMGIPEMQDLWENLEKKIQTKTRPSFLSCWSAVLKSFQLTQDTLVFVHMTLMH